MLPPMISYVTWNRMGLTARNLSALLSGSEDFELCIVDNSSCDNSWEYLNSLKDGRIKSRVRFDANKGHVYATNFNLSKRKKEQIFITIDNDVHIHTENWISQFLKAFDEFPEVGLLGAVTEQYYDNYYHPYVRKEHNGTVYLQMHRGFVEGCCQCIRPEVLDLLGYWNEENCIGDMEMCYRIGKFTPFRAGFLPAVKIDQVQNISCSICTAKEHCSLDRPAVTCFLIHSRKYSSPSFKALYGNRYREFIRETVHGRPKAYCPSIHDPESMKKGEYDAVKAENNFRVYTGIGGRSIEAGR